MDFQWNDQWRIFLGTALAPFMAMLYLAIWRLLKYCFRRLKARFFSSTEVIQRPQPSQRDRVEAPLSPVTGEVIPARRKE